MNIGVTGRKETLKQGSLIGPWCLLSLKNSAASTDNQKCFRIFPPVPWVHSQNYSQKPSLLGCVSNHIRSGQ